MNDNAPPLLPKWSFTTIQGESGRWIAVGMHVNGQSTASSSQNEDDTLIGCKEVANDLSASEER